LITVFYYKAYVSLIGLLQAQFCLGGYDSAAHMTEETKKADVAGPTGMVGALVGSSLLGWFFVVALLMGIKDYDTTVATVTGFPVTQILLDNFGRSWTLVLMCLLMVAIWFCGLITVTATSRLMYAFSRDHAMVRRDLSSKILVFLRHISLYPHSVFFFNSCHDLTFEIDSFKSDFIVLAIQSFMAYDPSSIFMSHLWCLALMCNWFPARNSIFN
jgi:hypothetical protein